MLRASLGFFIFGLIAIALGMNGVGGMSIEVGRLLLFVFLGLAVLAFLGALVIGKGVKNPPMLLMAAILLGSTAGLHAPLAHADESVGTKMENKAGDVSTDAKVHTRKGKRHVRKAMGKDNAAKDAKDAANDAGDNISNSAKKLKRKAE